MHSVSYFACYFCGLFYIMPDNKLAEGIQNNNSFFKNLLQNLDQLDYSQIAQLKIKNDMNYTI